MRDLEVLHGDALEQLRLLPAGLARTCVTSPPYWGLRDYGVGGQVGLEASPEEWCARLVEVFGEVRRILADDGTLWLNVGDCYAGNAGGGQWAKRGAGLKSKDLIGLPWMLAFALRAGGWYLRCDIVWSKPNPMPESVTDRPTRSHEFLFLLSKQRRYYYDADAIREPCEQPASRGLRAGVSRDDYDARKWKDRSDGKSRPPMTMRDREYNPRGRNKRSVWEIATQATPEAHFATFPDELVRPCVRAGSAPGDRVLDPFAGTATVGMVAAVEGRRFVGVELNPEYVEMARRNLHGLGIQGVLL